MAAEAGPGTLGSTPVARPLPDPFIEPPADDGPTLAAAVGWVLALVGFAVGARPIGDNSFLTHLATGRLMLDERAVPTVDPYSYGAAGESWTVQSWLVSAVYATLEAGPGLWSVRVLNGALGCAVIVGLWRLSEPARGLMVRVGLVGLVLVIGTFLWPPRPLLVALVALTLVLMVADGRLAPQWLVPIFWVWVNSHGSFVLGGGLVAMIAVGAAIDERGIPFREFPLVLWAGVGALSGMVGPLGPRLLWFPLHLMGRNEALEQVAEWGSPSFRSPVEQLYLVILVLLVVAASRRAPWRALLPSVVFFVAGLMAVRNLGVASIVIVALLAPNLDLWPRAMDGSVRGFMPRAVSVAALTALCASVAVTAVQPAVSLDTYPVDEVTWLEERDLVATDGVHLAQRDFVGNYLHYRYGADARVFMDDRFDFHPIDTVKDHVRLLGAGDKAAIVERQAFDVILWEASSSLQRWLVASDDWRIVRSDNDWIIACRLSSAANTRC
ncbi:MAG: hypothetical protein AAGD35_12765 [Actinomycetota bacterium]